MPEKRKCLSLSTKSKYYDEIILHYINSRRLFNCPFPDGTMDRAKLFTDQRATGTTDTRILLPRHRTLPNKQNKKPPDPLPGGTRQIPSRQTGIPHRYGFPEQPRYCSTGKHPLFH